MTVAIIQFIDAVLKDVFTIGMWQMSKSIVPRKNIKLHPTVMILLEEFKEVIHDHASPKSLRHPDKKPYRMPMSWNDFFTLIIADWNGGRMKCHCGHFYDCPHCRLMIDVNEHLVREKLKKDLESDK